MAPSRFAEATAVRQSATAARFERSAAALNRVTRGLLGAFWFVGAEFGVVTLLKRSQIASVWELNTGALWLAPSAFVAAACVGLLGTGLYELGLRAERLPARLAFALLVALAAAASAFGVSTGRHLADPGLRTLFVGSIALSAGMGVYFGAPSMARLLRGRRGLAALALAALILGLELSNRFVLPRLYPAFHWALSIGALALAPWFSRSTEGPGKRRAVTESAAVLAVVAISLGVLLPSARRLAGFDNFRLLLLDEAPVLGRAVELAARLAPPEQAESLGCAGSAGGTGCVGEASGALATGSLDFRGRDVLLVTVDALRADHVGVYGAARPTTPAIDRLAEDAAVFEHAYTATPHTSYALTSLMTGKYMRPLLLQGAGADSDTWASLLRTYGYRTAAFYPPAVFFIDTQLFSSFQRSNLGFEYAKVEFAEGEARVLQVRDYLATAPTTKPLFLWVHLFGPHEPYVAHAAHPFGDRDIDRYDSEVADADDTLGQVVDEFRRRRPTSIVIVSADHGEEFGDHGGRYHGTTVYEEQLRVPLIISAPGLLKPQRVGEVVQSVDLLPTLLGALRIPRPPRLRGRDLGALLSSKRAPEPGLAYAETDEQTLLAHGPLRLICARRIGACKLYDLASDPREENDRTNMHSAEADKMRAELREISVSHGRYESQGLRAEGKGWPSALLRGLEGDADAAVEVAGLLDDVDPAIRRKAAEVLFELRRPESAPALRLALNRDDAPEVRRYAALALTRLGEGAPLVAELLESKDLELRRLAALALGESGDRRGLAILLDWWRDAKARNFQRSRDLLEAFATLKAKDAVGFLTASLADVRLRPYLARCLAKIGDSSARIPLTRAFADERSQTARAELAQALVALGAREELAQPLTRFLGVPDPLADGVRVATEAHILVHVGGPSEHDLPRLRSRSELGTRLRVVVPKGGNGQGVRAIVRAACPAGPEPGTIMLSSSAHLLRFDRAGKALPEHGVPALDESRALRLALPCDGRAHEVFGTLSERVGVRPGTSTELILFTSRNIELEGAALVPLADELPPPPPKPWSPESPGE